MYYEKIDGWFNYERYYEWVLSQLSAGIFVEIGIWKGKSITFMAERIKAMDKKISLFAVDTFEGTLDEPSLMADSDIVRGSLYETYLKNIEPVKEFIYTIKGDSHLVYNQFDDNSIDVLFIDGDHSYEGVRRDIELWYSKVKSDGIISGHDFGAHAPGVIQAVTENFPQAKLFDKDSSVWYYKKEL